MSNTRFPLQVSPTIPAAIGRLPELTHNFLFSWYPPAGLLFRNLDSALWRRTDSNPKLFLRCVDQLLLDQAANDPAFLTAYRSVLAEYDRYLQEGRPTPGAADLAADDLIAYFCAEFGFHESFPIYSGGLGVLAGDHCKTASDLSLPFVGVGLLYRQGYFTQRIDRNGQQVPEYPHIDPRNTPLTPALGADGREVRVSCPFGERAVAVRVWRAHVGRVIVLFLDTDVEENTAEDRKITYVLYGGDRELRLQQEAILGVAGVRALRALGLKPTVWHINEGHAAFSVLERVREHCNAGLPFAAALEATAACTVFTTHTPVSAGHDLFSLESVAQHFSTYPAEFKVSVEELLDLGRSPEQHDSFNMTRLALRGAAAVNGVSKIHGGVSARLYQSTWPEVPPAENVVGYVTNGVHVPTFLRQAWAALFDEHLGAGWRQQLMDRTLFRRILEIPDSQFWSTNQKVKTQMLRVLRARLAAQHTRNGLSEAHIQRLLKLVNAENPNVLTVGFARRFATYKRATLLFTDLRWLEQLVSNEDRPIVFMFAGKAHPADEPAQWMMREIQRISSQPPFIGKILLIEGYDMGMNRVLAAGVDVWLNNPVPPFEASGTSGMKAAINGTVNLSVLDGWWGEAYDGKNGWGIPPSPDAQGPGERDRQDAISLYETLQDEVIPLYYERDPELGLAPGWVALCKRSMASVLPHFNSERVLHDYLGSFYVPAAKHGRAVAADEFRVARDLAQWRSRVVKAWPAVELKAVNTPANEVGFHEAVELQVDVHLNGLRPSDVRVECVVHRGMCSQLTLPVRRYADNGHALQGITYIDGETVLMAVFQAGTASPEGVCRYRLDLQPPWAGALSYEIRAVPQHPHLAHPYELGLMRRL
jgi:starch phosphorylase